MAISESHNSITFDFKGNTHTLRQLDQSEITVERKIISDKSVVMINSVATPNEIELAFKSIYEILLSDKPQAERVADATALAFQYHNIMKIGLGFSNLCMLGSVWTALDDEPINEPFNMAYYNIKEKMFLTIKEVRDFFFQMAQEKLLQEYAISMILLNENTANSLMASEKKKKKIQMSMQNLNE